jgi:LysM repeat protein
VEASAACTTYEYVYNGGFEGGFNAVSAGSVGKGWGFFTNGGAANYGSQQDQWAPVVAEGASSQLVVISTKGRSPADGDRYAGIYQHIGRLTPGVTYELSLRGLLRGDGPSEDPYRYEAQWGINAYGNTDWTKVGNWQGMDLGPITARTAPGPMATYRTRFVAPSSSIVLFIRGWSKWPTPEQEMDFNVDAISLKACSGGVVTPPPGDTGIPNPPGSCIHVVAPGETLGLIARRYNTTVAALASINQIKNIKIIYVGQHIIVPGCTNPQPPQPPPPPQQVRIHVVQRGETLSQIAKKYGHTTAYLAYCNGIRNPNLIYVGQRLRIP